MNEISEKIRQKENLKILGNIKSDVKNISLPG